MTISSGPDTAVLRGPDLYERYFAQVKRACTLLSQAYGSLHGRDGVTQEARFESAHVVAYLNRFLASLAALRMRYTYRDALDRPLYIDLTDSGFPNIREMSLLEVDSRDAAHALRDRPGMSVLKRTLIDGLIHEGVDQPGVLASLSERAYLMMIEKTDDLFLTMTSVGVHARGESGDVRKYVATWGFYETTDNLPYLSILSFDQSMNDVPLEEASASREKFLEKIRQEGSRAGNLMVTAVEIDTSLQYIHPKFLKRMRLGPLYSTLLFDERDPSTLTQKESCIYDLLRTCAGPDDIVLLGRDDIVFSTRQEKLEHSLLRSFGFRKDVREVFYIPENNLEAYEHGLSHGHQYAVIPHRVVQHLTPAIMECVPELGPKVRKITYNEKGVVNVL